MSGSGNNKLSQMSGTNNGETKPETDKDVSAENKKPNKFKSIHVESVDLSSEEEISGLHIRKKEDLTTEFMEYEEYHLKKSKVTLFELKDDVNNELSMIIPFQVDLPKDTHPSFN